jgi:hypothetical protein
MQYSGLIIFSTLSSGVALWNIPRKTTPEPVDVLQADRPVLSQDTTNAAMAMVEQNHSSECQFKNGEWTRCHFDTPYFEDVVYDEAPPAPYSDDACKESSAPELDSRDVQGEDLWSLVTQWTSRRVMANAKLSDLIVATVGMNDAHDAAPLTNAPSVACIAVLPSGEDTFQRVRFLVDNFVEQTYEGSMQLIIVADDGHESEEALASFVDGVTVKAVHAPIDRMDLAALYRLGLDEADDADILARWDWNAWHHPDRLALQIRTMVLTSRPVSHLRTWTTTHDGSEAPRQEELGEPTLVGEREWMKRYWYPGHHEEQLQTAHSRHFVELDHPKLVAYGSARYKAR